VTTVRHVPIPIQRYQYLDSVRNRDCHSFVHLQTEPVRLPPPRPRSIRTTQRRTATDTQTLRDEPTYSTV